jgi:hypothetical protein
MTVFGGTFFDVAFFGAVALALADADTAIVGFRGVEDCTGLFV